MPAPFRLRLGDDGQDVILSEIGDDKEKLFARIYDKGKSALVVDVINAALVFCDAYEKANVVICEPCKDKSHIECKGDSWCDCQHKPAPQVLKPAGIESGEAVGDLGGV